MADRSITGPAPMRQTPDHHGIGGDAQPQSRPDRDWSGADTKPTPNGMPGKVMPSGPRNPAGAE